MDFVGRKRAVHLQSCHTRLLIKNGTLVDAETSTVFDIYISDGAIRQVGKNLITPGGARVIDAKGLLILPGGIDTRANLKDPENKTDFYQASKVAIAGGTTVLVDTVFPTSGQSPARALDHMLNLAEGKVCCDYTFNVSIAGLSENTVRGMRKCVNKGVNVFELSGDYTRLLSLCMDMGAIPKLKDLEGLKVAEGMNCQVYLTDDSLGKFGNVIARERSISRCDSPLEVEEYDVFSSGLPQDKDAGGHLGVNDRLSIIWDKCVESGLLTQSQFVAVTSTNAAKVLNMFPRKGSICIGSDADLVIWNRHKPHFVEYGPFKGHVRGAPEYVIVGGRVCFEEGECRVAQGFGKFLSRKVHSERLAPSNGQPSKKGNRLSMEVEKKVANKQYQFSDIFSSGPEPKASIRISNPPGGRSSGPLW